MPHVLPHDLLSVLLSSVLSMPLTDLDRRILAIEAKQWRYAGRKDAAIMGLGLTAVTYAATLARLAQDPDAEAEYPVLVHRIQRRLATARRQRAARRQKV